MTIRPSDKLFSQYIRTRDNWTCQRCGRQYEPPTSALHCSHFMGRGKEATRFDPDNCDALCYGCHQYFTSHPALHLEWQVKRKGQKMVDAIILQSNGYKKRDDKFEMLIWRQALKDLMVGTWQVDTHLLRWCRLRDRFVFAFSLLANRTSTATEGTPP